MKLSDLGPGLLLAATGIGVGDMVSTTIAGADYGLTLVWALAAGVVVKLAITEGAARWQLATGATLVEGWRDHLPRAVLLVFFVYFVVWSYAVSSALVAASALVPAAIVPAVPLWAWGLAHAAAAFVMVYYGRYGRFLATIKWLIVLKFGAIVATVLLILFWSGPDWSRTGATRPLSTPYILSLIGGVGGTVTLLSYSYWMREEGWSGVGRIGWARADLLVSFSLVLIFCLSMMFLATQVEWQGQILDEGPRLCLLLADRIGAEIGPIGRTVFLFGFWGTAFASVLGVWHGVPFLFDDWLRLYVGSRARPEETSYEDGDARAAVEQGVRSGVRQRIAGHVNATGQQGLAYRSWALYLTLASISALVIGRSVWIVFVYTVIGSLFFPFVIATLLWLNNSKTIPHAARNGLGANLVLGSALLLYGYLALG